MDKRGLWWLLLLSYFARMFSGTYLGRESKQDGRVQIIQHSMRTVHRLVVKAVEVCAEHDTGGWRDAGGEEGRKDMQTDRDFSYAGERNEQTQKGVQCSARVKQITTYQNAHCDSRFLMEEAKVQKQQLLSLCYALHIPTEHPQYGCEGNSTT